MRDSVELAIDRDEHAATHTPATLILNCKRCGSHFEQDYEELLCWQCIAWAELLDRGDSYSHAVRGQRGGGR